MQLILQTREMTQIVPMNFLFLFETTILEITFRLLSTIVVNVITHKIKMMVAAVPETRLTLTTDNILDNNNTE